MTNLRLQKKLAAAFMRVGKGRVKISPESAEEVKQAITKADIGSLITKGIITVKEKVGTSRHRAKKRHAQQKKGRQRGYGSRKGTENARLPKKRRWINKIRIQRRTLSELKEKEELSVKDYRKMYLKAKGGFFRSKKHMILYLTQHKMIKETKK